MGVRLRKSACCVVTLLRGQAMADYLDVRYAAVLVVFVSNNLGGGKV